MLLLIVTTADLRSYQIQHTPSSCRARGVNCGGGWLPLSAMSPGARRWHGQGRFILSSAAALRWLTTPGRPASTYDNRLPSPPANVRMDIIWRSRLVKPSSLSSAAEAWLKIYFEFIPAVSCYNFNG